MYRRTILEIIGSGFAAPPTRASRTRRAQTGFSTSEVGRLRVSDAMDQVVDTGNEEIRADSQFHLISKPDIERLYQRYRKSGWTPSPDAYRRSVLDCEEYAMAFRVYAALQGVNGMALVHDLETAHAYILAATTGEQGLEFVIVDPTNDTLVEVGDAGDLYSLGYGYRYV